MNHALRTAAAHVLVDDLELPELDDDGAHHLFRVLRLADGEPVTVTDGRGGWRPCRVASGRLEPVGERTTVARTRPAIELYVAIPKQDRPEWLVQKLTELGVDRIVFVHADRSVVRWSADRAARHRHRLAKVVAAAAMQSRRVWLPSIEGPTASDDVLATPARVVVAEPGGRALTARDRRVAIGPEGGWSPRELALAPERVDLGDAVFRVETAAIAAAAVMTYLRGAEHPE